MKVFMREKKEGKRNINVKIAQCEFFKTLFIYL